MPEPETSSTDLDFDAQLRGLFQEAEQVMGARAIAARPPEPESAAPLVLKTLELSEQELPTLPKASVPSLPQVLRPVVLGLEAMARAAGENTALLQKLDKNAEAAALAQQSLPQLVADLRTVLEQKSGVNQRMFDALHEELKGYKDGFLLESVHRPIIRDLITLYDDLVEIHRQMGASVTDHAGIQEVDAARGLVERIKTMEMNIEHNIGFIVEVLARLEVTPMPIGTGKLDKRTQRAVAVEMAEDPDDDTTVVRTAKRGFLWKERVLRAEEVVIKKWKEGFLIALGANGQK